MTTTTTHHRVSYPGAPTAGEMPQEVNEAIDQNLQRSQIHDLIHARSIVSEAINRNEVPESEMLRALDFMENSEAALTEKRNQVAQMTKATQAPKPSPQAPAVVRSVGDSFGSLAKDFSVTRAIDTVASGRSLNGAEAEAYTEARNEFSAARGHILMPSKLRAELRNVYGNDSGQSGIDANVSGKQVLSQSMDIARHIVPMAQQLGARRIDATGSATMLVPYLGRTDAASADEGAATSSSAQFLELSLTPQRYTRKASISALALSTTGQQLDSILLNDFDRAHAAAHDKVVFDAIRDNATFTTASLTGADMAATSLADLFKLMTDTMNATGVSGYFDLLASPIALEALNTAIVTNADQTLAQMFVQQTGRRIIPIASMTDSTFAEADAIGTTGGDSIAGAGHVVAGDMSAAVAASWGGLSLTVDEVTLRDNGVINVHCDSYCSAGIVSDAFRILAVSDAAIATS